MIIHGYIYCWMKLFSKLNEVMEMYMLLEAYVTCDDIVIILFPKYPQNIFTATLFYWYALHYIDI